MRALSIQRPQTDTIQTHKPANAYMHNEYTFTISALKTLPTDTFWTAQQINTIIFCSWKVFYFPNTNQKCIFICVTRGGIMFNDNRASGDLHPGKQIRAFYFLLLQDQIFGARCSQFPRGSLRGLLFCAPSSVGDKWKTFWLSLQGESAGRKTVSYAVEHAGCL